MKTTLRTKALSIAVVLFMLLAALPIGIFANEDDSEESTALSDGEIVEEVPFEFPYLPGDIPLYELKDAVLNLSEVPAVISRAQIAEYDHVNRLYEQEPDEYTVIFQNRDGGKTVYVFDRPVKTQTADGAFADMTASAIVSASRGDNSVSMMAVGISNNTATTLKAMQSRLEAYKAALNLQPYNILEDQLDTQTLTTAGLSADLSTPMQITPDNSTAVMSVSNTYSNLAGEIALKNVGTGTYLMQSGNAFRMHQYISIPYSKWLLTYVGSEGYIIESLSKVGYVLSHEDGSNSVTLQQYDPEMEGPLMRFYWQIGATPNGVEGNYYILAQSKLLTSSLTLSYSDGSFPGEVSWQLTNRLDYVYLEGVSFAENVIYVEEDSYIDLPALIRNPSNASYASNIENDYEFFSTNEDVISIDGLGYLTGDGIGDMAQIYLRHKYTGIYSSHVTVIIGDDPNIIPKTTYLLRPISNIDKLLTMNVGSSNLLCLDSWRDTWNSRSQAFSITENGDGSYKISAIMSTNQYSVPFSGSGEFSYTGAYALTDKHQMVNTLALSSSDTLGLVAYKNSAGDITTANIKWYIYKDGSSFYIYSQSGTTKYYLSHNKDNGTVNVSTSKTNANWMLSFLGVDAPCIKQTTDYYCGVASTLQVLMTVEAEGYGPEDNVDLGVKIRYLNSTYNMTTTNGLRGWEKIPQAMIDELDEGTYALLDKDDCSESAVRQLLLSSLESGYPLIGSIYDRLDYYPNTSAYYKAKHYVCIMGYDSLTDKVIISDCIYESHFGIHIVSLDDLIDALNNGILYYVN